MYSCKEFEAREIGTPFLTRCLIRRLAPGSALASAHLNQIMICKQESVSVNKSMREFQFPIHLTLLITKQCAFTLKTGLETK